MDGKEKVVGKSCEFTTLVALVLDSCLLLLGRGIGVA
jgi:hypothetical protein